VAAGRLIAAFAPEGRVRAPSKNVNGPSPVHIAPPFNRLRPTTESVRSGIMKARSFFHAVPLERAGSGPWTHLSHPPRKPRGHDEGRFPPSGLERVRPLAARLGRPVPSRRSSDPVRRVHARRGAARSSCA